MQNPLDKISILLKNVAVTTQNFTNNLRYLLGYRRLLRQKIAELERRPIRGPYNEITLSIHQKTAQLVVEVVEMMGEDSFAIEALLLAGGIGSDFDDWANYHYRTACAYERVRSLLIWPSIKNRNDVLRAFLMRVPVTA